MSEKIIKINDSEFDSLVIIPRKPAVVFFTADWSGPSRMAKPILDAAAAKYKNRATFYELNVDENYATAMKYNVKGLPVVLTFAFGQLVGQSVGGINRDKINELVEAITNSGEAYQNAMAFTKKFAAHYGIRFGA